MRKILIALLSALLALNTVTAQEVCGDALPPRLEVGKQGLVDTQAGFFLNVREAPGLNGAEMLRLAQGEIVDVVDGPQCVDGFQWWQIQQFDLTGWVAEAAGSDYMIAPFDREALPTLAPLPTPALESVLSPVLLADNPADLQTAFIQWDWAGFLEDTDSFYSPPDPLPVELPETYLGDLPAGPFDLAEVRFLDDAALNDAQQALLAQNGFVVVPGGMPFFEDVYRWNADWDYESGHSYWVTTDSVLHALHAAFDNMLKFLEMDVLHGALRDVIEGSYAQAADQLAQVADTPLAVPAQAAAVYYAVALGLLDHDLYAQMVDAAVRAEADPLIDAALNGEGRLEVPFLPDYREDFSQYMPRGHYANAPQTASYFRAMMWLGRITFLTNDDDQLHASLFALRALDAGNQVDGWASISDLLTFLIGPTDNLGPADYLPLAQAIFGPDLSPGPIGDDDLLAEFRAELQALPGPRINNVVRPLGTEADELDDATRGFRLFGQRFTLDAYVMQRLIYPYVGVPGDERALPSGLDVAAALGSDVAYQLLDTQGDTAKANYVDNIIELRSDVSQLNPPDWFQNAYGGWLWALQPLWAQNAEQYPAMMDTEAWQRRDLQAGLASWAELKHDTILYVAQPMGGLGGGGERILNTHGMVEPNPLVFSRVAVVSAAIEQGLAARGLGDYAFEGGPPPATYLAREAFQTLAQLSAILTEMARKELWGEPLTEDEQLFLKYDFGNMLWVVRYYAEQPLEINPEMGAVVADVASNVDAGTVLEVGTGMVDLIYVITDSPDGLQLTRGSVYSYYEFEQPIDQRLTDDAWRESLTAGDVPPRPNWIAAFYAE